jgi:uncharacterized protein (DUF3084 family)
MNTPSHLEQLSQGACTASHNRNPSKSALSEAISTFTSSALIATTRLNNLLHGLHPSRSTSFHLDRINKRTIKKKKLLAPPRTAPNPRQRRACPSEAQGCHKHQKRERQQHKNKKEKQTKQQQEQQHVTCLALRAPTFQHNNNLFF